MVTKKQSPPFSVYLGIFLLFCLSCITSSPATGLPLQNTPKATTIPMVPKVRFYDSAGWWPSPHLTYILFSIEGQLDGATQHPRWQDQAPRLDYLLPIYSLVFLQLILSPNTSRKSLTLLLLKYNHLQGMYIFHVLCVNLIHLYNCTIYVPCSLTLISV